MVCLGNEQRSFCRFGDCIQVLHFRLFCWPWWLLHFFWGIPARSSRYNGHELNSPIPVHFSSLIPRMLTFSLAISCLTTSNLPWFMDLTFQVPMQYCSFQHYWSGHWLGLLRYWMVSLGNEQRSFCRFWDCIQVLHFGLFFWPMKDYSISSK